MEAVLHKLLQQESFSDCSSSQTAPAWVFSRARSPSGTDFSAPHTVNSCHQTCSGHGLLSQHMLPRDSSSIGFPQVNSLPQASTCSNMRSSTGCRGTAASPWSAPQAAGESQFWHMDQLLSLPLHGPWYLQSCFSHVFSLLSPVAISLLQYLFPLLNQVIPEALRLSLTGLALALLDMGKLLAVFTEATPVAPSLPHKTVPCKPTASTFSPSQGTPIPELSN